MKFYSTRDRDRKTSFTFSQAVELGLAPDGGLFVPDHFPRTATTKSLELLPVAISLLKPFLEGELTDLQLEEMLATAFNFPAPLEPWDDHTWLLDLTKGPTAAFKDFGARFLAGWMRLKQKQAKVILVATSGDTGGAVASAFDQVHPFQVVLLFPKDGVSSLQKKQLSCWGQNILSLEVEGSFDDAQKIVKQFLADENLRQKLRLTSANSISLARLLPQACYYAHASLVFQQKTGLAANFVVPTGNMGNVLAAIWTKQMGYPIKKIRVASNANLTLSEYWKSKNFQPRQSIRTLANAMDVGNPSNFERYQYLVSAQKNELLDDILSVSDNEIRQQIQRCEKIYGKAICPHTACAFAVKDPNAVEIIVQTADAAKFSEIVEPLVKRPVLIPSQLQDLLHRPSRYQTVKATPEAISAEIEKFLS